MSDKHLTVAEVCDLLNISRPKLYDLLRDGAIRSFKIGRSRRIPASSVEEFVERQLLAEGSAA